MIVTTTTNIIYLRTSIPYYLPTLILYYPITYSGLVHLSHVSYLNTVGHEISLKQFCASDVTSGHDNRNLVDDGTSQKLTKEEIKQMQTDGATGQEVCAGRS